MGKAGKAEAATTMRALPIVFVPNKNGHLRFRVDYRRLNAVTEKNRCWFSRIDECIDSLSEARVLQTHDANSGYCHIKVDSKDVHKTAYVTHSRPFGYTKMLLAFQTAPATFQRAVNVILAFVKWHFAIVYIDDISISYQSPQ